MLWLRLFRKKTVGYVSDIDKFCVEWDATHPKTASQLAEIKKYKQVYSLRDIPQGNPTVEEKHID